MLKLHIIIAYNNRKKQFLRTLNSFEKSIYSQNIIVIVVDDGSDVSNRLENIVNDYSFEIRLIRIEGKIKTWTNPCVTYNIGFAQIDINETNNKIIIQNPECFHYGDVIAHVEEHLNNENYLSYDCLSLPKWFDHSLIESDRLIKILASTTITSEQGNPENQVLWYSHSKYKRKALHFCTAISFLNLRHLNGFNLEYSNGHCYDDDEFFERIKQLGLNIDYVNGPFSIHQFHDMYRNSFSQDDLIACEKNRILLDNSLKNNLLSSRANRTSKFGLINNN